MSAAELGITEENFNLLLNTLSDGSEESAGLLQNILSGGDTAIATIADIRTMLPNHGVRCGMGFYDRFGRSAYELSISLEDM